eukprot:1231081-Amphidinium_carterae.1
MVLVPEEKCNKMGLMDFGTLQGVRPKALIGLALLAPRVLSRTLLCPYFDLRKSVPLLTHEVNQKHPAAACVCRFGQESLEFGQVLQRTVLACSDRLSTQNV